MRPVAGWAAAVAGRDWAAAERATAVAGWAMVVVVRETEAAATEAAGLAVAVRGEAMMEAAGVAAADSAAPMEEATWEERQCRRHPEVCRDGS